MSASPSIASHPPASSAIATVDSLDQEGRGIARVNGKAIFVEGALPGETVTLTTLKRKPTYELARAETIVKANAGARRSALPAFRRVRRLLAAALRRRRAGRGQATHARRRAVASRPRARGAAAAADSRSGLALPASRAALGAARREERRRARRLPRAQVELRRRHDVVRDPAAQDLRPAARAPRADRGIDRSRPRAADRARGRATAPTTPTCSCCGFSSRWRAPTRLRSPSSPIGMACSSTCSPADPQRQCRFAPAGPQLAYALPEFDLVFPFSPTEFTQVNPAINRTLVGARWRCSIRGRASASPISSAGSAISRCRSRGAARPSSASRATPRSCAGPRRSRRRTR